MPKQTHTIGSTLDHKNISFSVDEDMMWVKVGKQRGGFPAGRSWMCRIDYQLNYIEPDRGFHALEYKDAQPKGKTIDLNGSSYLDELVR